MCKKIKCEIKCKEKVGCIKLNIFYGILQFFAEAVKASDRTLYGQPGTCSPYAACGA